MQRHFRQLNGALLAAALLSLGFCSTANAVSWQASSELRNFVVDIAPVQGDVAIGEFQVWTLKLQYADGSAVRGAEITVSGGMRAHGHGLPTQPVVSESMRAGHYRIEGVKLNMNGQWTLALSIRVAETNDRVVVELDLRSTANTQHRILQSLAFNERTSPPADPSNQFADDPAAAQLGKLLFGDARLSRDGEISCATCHQPEKYFVDGRPLGQGIGKAMRNTPTLVGAAYQSWFYWDGRRDSLWSQALVPFEAPDEMGSSRLAVVRHVYENKLYRESYESLFGAMPKALRPVDWPQHAGPLGDSLTRDAWHRLDRKQRDAIDLVFANIGKSIAAYERTLSLPFSRFDRYVNVPVGDQRDQESQFSSDELAGLALFLDDTRTSCLRCHNGQWFTNNSFQNIGTGNFSGEHLDFGRVYGLQSAIRDVFNCIGPYSDVDRDECDEWKFLNRDSHVPLEGAFKVPSLRNLEATAPYMHDGRFGTLKDVIEYYRNPATEGPPHELTPLVISDEEAEQLHAFLLTLSATKTTPLRRH